MPGALRIAAAMTSTVASAALLASIGGLLPAFAKTVTATEDVNIRSGPGTSHKIVGGLERGQQIHSVGRARKGWIRVKFEAGSAWIAARYLSSGRTTVTAPASLYRAGTRITTAALNIRTGPGLGYDVVGTVAEDRAVTLTGRFSRGFAETLVDGQRRWVSAQYLASSASKIPARTVDRVASADLDIRATPSPRAHVVTEVAKGTVLATTGATSGAYAQIVFRGAIRWVTARYLANAKVVLPVAAPAPPASSRGVGALAFARAQLGKPYVFGAEGPRAYDCSGLVQAAWRSVRVSIPRTTYQQFKVGYRVSRSNLKLGDLVFFYGSSPSHVGIYAGNGRVIHAPRPGKVVQYIPISYMPYAGAVRPG